MAALGFVVLVLLMVIYCVCRKLSNADKERAESLVYKE
jgi:hypothetical protein